MRISFYVSSTLAYAYARAFAAAYTAESDPHVLLPTDINEGEVCRSLFSILTTIDSHVGTHRSSTPSTHF
jgi:hypothetical protein